MIRRPGTVAFGVFCSLVGVGPGVYGLAGGSSVIDNLFGGMIIGLITFFGMFRVTVWPAVIVTDQSVVVRNPLVTYRFVDGTVELLTEENGAVVMVADSKRVPAFALSGSILDMIFGSRTTKRLQSALTHRRVLQNTPARCLVDRTGVVKQLLLFLAGFELLAVVLGLAI